MGQRRRTHTLHCSHNRFHSPDLLVVVIFLADRGAYALSVSLSLTHTDRQTQESHKVFYFNPLFSIRPMCLYSSIIKGILFYVTIALHIVAEL